MVNEFGSSDVINMINETILALKIYLKRYNIPRMFIVANNLQLVRKILKPLCKLPLLTIF